MKIEGIQALSVLDGWINSGGYATAWAIGHCLCILNCLLKSMSLYFSNCNFIIISTSCGLVAAKRHFTSINYDVIFSFDADRKLPTLCQQQNTFTLLLSVTIDATSTTLLMSFGLGSFKFLDQNLTIGPELAAKQKVYINLIQQAYRRVELWGIQELFWATWMIMMVYNKIIQSVYLPL